MAKAGKRNAIDNVARPATATVAVTPDVVEAASTYNAEVAKDKIAEAVGMIKERSGPIVIRGLLAAPLPDITVAAVSDRLDEALGIDGWGVEYKVFTPLPDITVLCAIHVRISGQWNYKQGLGVGDVVSASAAQRVIAAQQRAFLAAASMLGVGCGISKKVADRLASMGTPVASVPDSSPATNREQAKPKVDEAARVAELKKFWTAKLCECGNPDDLNEMVRGQEARTMPEFAKALVFQHIKTEAAAVGWIYDPQTRLFFEPRKDDDAVDASPF